MSSRRKALWATAGAGLVIGLFVGVMLFRTSDTTIYSFPDGGALLDEATGTALVVTVDPKAIEDLGEFEYENGYTVRRYRLDLAKAQEAAPVTAAGLEMKGKGSVEFERSIKYWEPLTKVTAGYDEVLLLIQPLTPTTIAGTVFGLSNGDLVVLDWEAPSDEASIFNAARGSTDAATAIVAMAKTRLDEMGRGTLGSDERDVGLAVLDALWPDRDARLDLSVAEAWDRLSVMERFVDIEAAPDRVLDGRVDYYVLVNVQGYTDQRQGEILYIHDGEGVLYGFEVGVGTHVAEFLLDPAKPVLTFASTTDADYPEARGIGSIDLNLRGSSLFGAEVLVDLSGSGDGVITLVAVYESVDTFAAAQQARFAEQDLMTTGEEKASGEG